LRIQPSAAMLIPRQKLVREGCSSRIDNELAGSLYQERDNHGGHAPGAVLG
jgi:hypothetical protein